MTGAKMVKTGYRPIVNAILGAMPEVKVPEGMDVGLKFTSTKQLTHGGYPWPSPGEWADTDEWSPELCVGGGFHAAMTILAAQSGGHRATNAFLVAWDPTEVVTDKDQPGKVKAPRMLTLTRVDIYGLARKGAFAGVDLVGADFPRANLAGANLAGTNLARAKLISADLTGANLISADLTGADLAFANLIGTDLAGTNLAGTNLAGTNLICAKFVSADLTRASLAGANLTSANFSNARLVGANLIGADLTCADLAGANFSDARLTGAIFTGAEIEETCFIRADLINTDFRRTNLRRADFTNANLSGAYFRSVTGGVIADEHTRWPEGFDPVERGVVVR